MNLPNKITMGRIVLAVIVLILLVFPFYQVGFTWPKYLVGKLVIDLKYVICGILFAVAGISDFFDGQIARKQNIVTDFGKVMDAIADKILVNGVLIVLAYDGFIPVIIPVIIITRDICTDTIKMLVGSKGNAVPASWPAKVKTFFMMFGVALVFFYNLPFSLMNIAIGNYLIFVATVLSIYSGVQYYSVNKEFFIER